MIAEIFNVGRILEVWKLISKSRYVICNSFLRITADPNIDFVIKCDVYSPIVSSQRVSIVHNVSETTEKYADTFLDAVVIYSGMIFFILKDDSLQVDQFLIQKLQDSKDSLSSEESMIIRDL